MRKNNQFHRKASEELGEETMIFVGGSEPSSNFGGFDLFSGSTQSSDPRAIWIFSDLSEGAVGSIIQQIHSLNYEDERKEKEYALENQVYSRQPINLYVSSFGGSIVDGFGLIGMIQSSKTPVHTYAIGKTMSMGVAICLAGHRRFAYPHSTFMIHSLSGGVRGKYADMQESALEDKRLQNKLDSLITARTSIPQKRLNEVHKQKLDWYFDAEEAVTLGLIEAIV